MKKKKRKEESAAPDDRAGSSGRGMLRTVFLLLLSAALLTLWCLLIGTRSEKNGLSMVGAYFTERPIILLLNFLPVFAVMTVAFVLINRAWIAWLVTSVFFLLIVFVRFTLRLRLII